MYLSGKPRPFETTSVPPQRAGLRIAPSTDEPTGVFEVIEMAVLVLVVALAMASIIVAGSEDDGHQRHQLASGIAGQRAAARFRRKRFAGRTKGVISPPDWV